MVTVEKVKQSLRIDHTLDDEMMGDIIATANAYIVSAIDANGDIEAIEALKQFDWAVSLLAQHWYLNRQEASSERVPVTVLSLIQQMRGAYYATH